MGKLGKDWKATGNTLVYLIFTYRKSNTPFVTSILQAGFSYEIYTVNKKNRYINVPSLVGPKPAWEKRGLD